MKATLVYKFYYVIIVICYLFLGPRPVSKQANIKSPKRWLVFYNKLMLFVIRKRFVSNLQQSRKPFFISIFKIYV